MTVEKVVRKFRAARYILAIAAIAVVLGGIAIATSQLAQNVFGELIESYGSLYIDDELNIDTNLAPAWLVNIEDASPLLAYFTWIAAPLLLIVFIKLPKTRKHLAESWDRQDVLFGLLISAVLSGVTGFLWAVWNPVPIIPGAIHLRIFAFLIGVWGIVIGRGTGFLTGYFGGIVWAWQGGYFSFFHRHVADGIWVGLAI